MRGKVTTGAAIPADGGVAVLVADGPSARRARAVLRCGGRRILAPGDLPSSPWSLEGSRSVVERGRLDAAEAVRARVRGATVLVSFEASRPDHADDVDTRLMADLRRLGPVVDWRIPGEDALAALDPEQVEVLGALTEAGSSRAAADLLHVSLRTFHRRLDASRSALGGLTTTAACSRLAVATAALDPAPDRDHSQAGCDLVDRGPMIDLVVGAEARSPVLILGVPGAGTSSILSHAGGPTGRRVLRTGALDLLRDEALLPMSRVLRREVGRSRRTALVSDLAGHVATGVLVVDDVQWLDGATWEVLAELGRRVPVVLGASCVDPGPVRAGASALGATIVEVDPLDHEGSLAVVSGREPSLDGVERTAIVALAGGLPGQLTRLGAGWNDPDLVDRTLRARVAAQPGSTCQVLARAFLAAEPLTGASRPGPDAELDALVAAGLVQRRHGGVVVDSATVRTSLERVMPREAQREAHRWLACHTEDTVAAANHWMEGGEPERAHRLARQALAEVRLPPTRAQILETAARCAPPAQRAHWVLEAADALVSVGELDAADALLDDLEGEDIDRVDDPRVVAARGRILGHRGDLAKARALVERRLAAAELTGAEEAALRSVLTALRAGQATDVDEVADLTLSAGHDAGFDPILRGASQVLTGDPRWPEVLIPIFEHALRQGTEAELALATDFVSQSAVLYADPPTAASVLERGISELERRGAAAWVLPLEILRANNHLMVNGPADAALVDLRLALSCRPVARAHGSAWGFLAVGLADRGRLGDAEEVLEEAEEHAELDPNARASLTWARAEVHLAAGRPAEALLGAKPLTGGPVTAVPTQTMALATCHWALLDGAGPTEVGLPSSPYPILRSLVDEAEGLRALTGGDTATAIGCFARCAEAPALLRDQRRQRWASGEALVRAGRVAEARAVLIPLAEEAQDAGLVGLEARARGSLRRLGVGGTARRPRRRGLGLTSRELEVLELVGAGCSTTVIAARLRLAPSTVDSTVRGAVRKLGARTRREAAAIVAGDQTRHTAADPPA